MHRGAVGAFESDSAMGLQALFPAYSSVYWRTYFGQQGCLQVFAEFGPELSQAGQGLRDAAPGRVREGGSQGVHVRALQDVHGGQEIIFLSRIIEL